VNFWLYNESCEINTKVIVYQYLCKGKAKMVSNVQHHKTFHAGGSENSYDVVEIASVTLCELILLFEILIWHFFSQCTFDIFSDLNLI